jgi:hypothetical protein
MIELNKIQKVEVPKGLFEKIENQIALNANASKFTFGLRSAAAIFVILLLAEGMGIANSYRDTEETKDSIESLVSINQNSLYNE